MVIVMYDNVALIEGAIDRVNLLFFAFISTTLSLSLICFNLRQCRREGVVLPYVLARLF